MKNIDNPLVSVLMTSYNREKYISEAIESVLLSTYKNFELIIVDDCSTDKTVDIASEYHSKDKRIQVHINEKNLGDYYNRNKAASFAKGKYIKYVDADDIIYSHGLEVMVHSMEKYPNAALGIQCNIREDILPYPILFTPRETFKEHFLKRGVLLSGPTGAIIKKDIFDKVGGFSGARYIGDTELWLKLSSKHEIVKFQPSLIWWRIHPDQEINKERKTFETTFLRYQLDKTYIVSDSCPLIQIEKTIALKKLNRRFVLNVSKHFLMNGDLINWIIYLTKSKIGMTNFIKAIFH
jgi:glycosyltransferase involved in cell wall biosynthesis